MSTWMTLILLLLSVALPAAFVFLPKLRTPTTMASTTLDFTVDRRRAPRTRRPPPGRRRGAQLDFRD